MSFEPEHATKIGLYLVSLAVSIALLSAFWFRYRTKYLPYILGLVLYAMLAILLALILAPETFEAMNMACYGTFIGGPIVLTVAQFAARQGKHGRIANLFVTLALLVAAIGIDAFLIEPHWLETTYITLETTKLSKPIKIAVIADIQMDHVTDYDRDVLKKVLSERPDLILLAGDYIQCLTVERQMAEMKKFRELLKQLNFTAPLGSYAVRGNQEEDSWRTMFKDLPITCFDETASLDIGPLVITGLTFIDSFNGKLKLKPQKKFHIALGHCPDFAMANPPADLLIAGHTHGGQVCLPFIGPLLTASHVPKSWASGRTEISPTSTLIVSRGVGLERWYAPRLRFLCRPELIFIALTPIRAR